jgi:hypothetical protein
MLQVASISQLTVSRLSRQCGILNISQPYRPPRPVTGVDLLFLSFHLNETQVVSECLNLKAASTHICMFYLWRGISVQLINKLRTSNEVYYYIPPGDNFSLPSHLPWALRSLLYRGFVAVRHWSACSHGDLNTTTIILCSVEWHVTECEDWTCDVPFPCEWCSNVLRSFLPGWHGWLSIHKYGTPIIRGNVISLECYFKLWIPEILISLNP